MFNNEKYVNIHDSYLNTSTLDSVQAARDGNASCVVFVQYQLMNVTEWNSLKGLSFLSIPY